MKKLLALTICFVFMAAGSVFAEPLKEHSWDLGTEISHITYDEPGVMEEKGVMYGVVGSYTYRNRFMLKAEGKGSWGQVDYDGQLSDGTAYTISDIDDYMFEFRGVGGYDFPVLTATILTPYIGFGYRYLNDDLSFDPAGYERESNYYYSPIGIETLTELQNGWSVGLTIEYDYFWKGIQKSHLEDFSASLDTLENDQDDGFGVRGSIKFQKKGEGVDYIIEPFIRYWDIDKSNVKAITYSGTPTGYVGWEPANDSTEIGGKIAVKF